MDSSGNSRPPAGVPLCGNVIQNPLHLLVQSHYYTHRPLSRIRAYGRERNCMNKKKLRRSPEAVSFSQARDELFSHILRCGVMEDLSVVDRSQLRVLGERFCQPVQGKTEPVQTGAA